MVIFMWFVILYSPDVCELYALDWFLDNWTIKFFVRVSEVNYFAYNIDSKFLSLCHFKNSTDKDWFYFSSYILFLTEQCTKWAYKIKPTQRDTLSDSFTVYCFFASHTGMEQFMKKKMCFFVWRKKKTFSYFHLLRKKTVEKWFEIIIFDFVYFVDISNVWLHSWFDIQIFNDKM